MFHSSDIEPYEKEHIHIGPIKMKQNFVPDKIALDILSILYTQFGYESEAIPFYNHEKEGFEFPS